MNVSSASRRFSYQDALDFLYDRINFEKWSDPPADSSSSVQTDVSADAGTVLPGSDQGDPLKASTTVKRSDYQFRLRRTEELARRLGLSEFLFVPPAPLGSAASEAASCQAVQPNAVPPTAIPLVHLAGTKGKGSTATMVSEILVAAGKRVGLYTSPHLTLLEERFRVDGCPCSQLELCELVALVEPVVLAMEASDGPVSFFELTTVMALLHFRRCDCDAIVLEVGLGGRLDSTNVFASTVAAITSIGLDHQQVLGDTLAEIAFEKAGIIKSQAPVISGAREPEAAAVIQTRASAANASLRTLGTDFLVQQRRLIAGGSEFEVHFVESDHTIPIRLALEGSHQTENAALAIAIIRGLAGVIDVTENQIQEGLARVKLIGRVERFELAGKVQVILDTAHNQDSFVALCDAIRARRVAGDDADTGVDILRSPVVVLFGCSRDKDAVSMIEPLSCVADHFVGTQFTTNPRFMPLANLQQAVAQFDAFKCHFRSDPMEAFDDALRIASPGGTLIICGSFFLAGQLRDEVEGRAIQHRPTGENELSP